MRRLNKARSLPIALVRHPACTLRQESGPGLLSRDAGEQQCICLIGRRQKERQLSFPRSNCLLIAPGVSYGDLPLEQPANAGDATPPGVCDSNRVLGPAVKQPAALAGRVRIPFATVWRSSGIGFFGAIRGDVLRIWNRPSRVVCLMS